MLRWASELAASTDSAAAKLGIAALDALSPSPWLHDEDRKLIAAVLDCLLAEDERAYRQAIGAQVVQIEPPKIRRSRRGSSGAGRRWVVVTQIIHVTPQQVAAAKLKAKLARAQGLPVDPATQAIADARPRGEGRNSNVRPGAADGQAG